MAVKRKMSPEFEYEDARSTKQLKLVPFPTYEADADVSMSDASSDCDSTPGFEHPRINHVSTASMWSSSSGSSSPVLTQPPLEHPLAGPASACNGPQPEGIASLGMRRLYHLAPGCTQIPKLRVACEAGPGGRRSIWSQCDQCGAVAMIDSDY